MSKLYDAYKEQLTHLMEEGSKKTWVSGLTQEGAKKYAAQSLEDYAATDHTYFGDTATASGQTYTSTSSSGTFLSNEGVTHADAMAKKDGQIKELLDRSRKVESELRKLRKTVEIQAAILAVLANREGGTVALSQEEVERGGHIIYDQDTDAAGFTHLHALPDYVAVGEKDPVEGIELRWHDKGIELRWHDKVIGSVNKAEWSAGRLVAATHPRS